MRKHMLLLACFFLQLAGCSDLPAPSAYKHAAVHHYCAQQTDPSCGPPMSVSLGEIFR